MEHSPDSLARRVDDIARSLAPTREPLGSREVECAEHGAYQSSGVRYSLGSMRPREIWSGCEACEESRIAAERQAEMHKKALAKQQQLEGMLQEALIPQRFLGRSLVNFRATTPAQEHALGVASDFAANFAAHAKRGSTLVFMGMPGTGKSHLATAILQHLMPDYCGLYTTCMNIIRAVRGTWRKDSERSETDILTMLGEVPLLVIDEIGVQYDTEGEKTLLFEVLDRRYREMQPTILLTNQNPAGLKTFIGERAFDRLTESAKFVVFDWPSYRATAAREAAEDRQ